MRNNKKPQNQFQPVFMGLPSLLTDAPSPKSIKFSVQILTLINNIFPSICRIEGQLSPHTWASRVLPRPLAYATPAQKGCTHPPTHCGFGGAASVPLGVNHKLNLQSTPMNSIIFIMKGLLI